jgi:hypothetical protein
MRIHRGLPLLLSILIPAALACSARAQQSPTSPTTAAPAKPTKPKPRPKPAATNPRLETAAPNIKPPPAVTGGVKPTLLGQYGDWGAYTASPNNKKICFAIARPASSETKPPGRPRNPIYLFISTRPAEKVADEISIVVGYPFKTGTEATAEVGTTTFALYTQGDGAWIKNAAEEAHMIEAMRGGETVVVKGTSAKGTQSIDTFSLKGIAQALDRADQECK